MARILKSFSYQSSGSRKIEEMKSVELESSEKVAKSYNVSEIF